MRWPLITILTLFLLSSSTSAQIRVEPPSSHDPVLGRPGDVPVPADYDGDGRAELFLGDLTASVGGRPTSGIGYVFYRADRLRGRSFNIDNRPSGIEVTRILGPSAGAIGSDTVAQGDFDGDGFGDLMIGSPHANPQGRMFAGVMHVLYGQAGGWPSVIDTAPGAFPPPNQVRITEIQGALGRTSSDEGDTLCYSAAAGDFNDDGKTDVITNEMVGNGIAPGSVDAGNLIILSGAFISAPVSVDPPSDETEPPEAPENPPEAPDDPPEDPPGELPPCPKVEILASPEVLLSRIPIKRPDCF